MDKNTEKILNAITALCEEKKAENISIYELNDKAVSDAVIMVSVTNNIHCQSLLQMITEKAKEELATLKSEEFYDFPKISGTAASGWCIVDLNVLCIHIINEELRHFYDLDTFFENKGVIYHA